MALFLVRPIEPSSGNPAPYANPHVQVISGQDSGVLQALPFGHCPLGH